MRYFPIFLVLWHLITSTALSASDRTFFEKALSEAELRLKSIYEKREFAPAPFNGKWLADSSGYLILEPSKSGLETEVVKYDAKNGDRTILIRANQLVAPGTKERLFVQRFFQTPLANIIYLQTRIGNWLLNSDSGDLKLLPHDLPQIPTANAFSPNGTRILFRRVVIFSYSI
jgi:hypothetical protein